MRLPLGQSNYFDYRIPKNINPDNIKRGQIVDIVLRGRKLSGVVWGITKNSSVANVKEFSALWPDSFSIKSSQLDTLPNLAKILRSSWPQTLFTLSLPLTKRKTHTHLPNYQSVKENIQSIDLPKPRAKTFIEYQNYDQVISLYCSIIKRLKDKEQILICVPNKITGLRIASIIKGADTQHQPLLISADLNKGQASKVWQAIASGQQVVVIGTKKSLWLPWYNLAYIIIDQAADTAHHQWDNQPRYNIAWLAKTFAEQNNSKLIWLDNMPSPRQYHLIKQEQWPYWRLPAQNIDKVQIKVNIGQWLSLEIIDIINDALAQQEKVLILSNRLHYGRQLMCQDCQYVWLCPHCSLPYQVDDDQQMLTCYHCLKSESVPTVCPNCHGSRLYTQGWGLERLQQALTKQFNNANIKTFSSADKNIPQADILLSSSAIWQHLWQFNPAKIIIPIAEQWLTPVDLDTKWRWLYEIRRWRSWGVPLLIQTYNEAEWADFIDNPLALVRNELRSLARLGLPPFAQIVKVIIKDSNKARALAKAWEQRKKIAQLLPQAKISAPQQTIPTIRHQQYQQQLIVTNLKSNDINKLIKAKTKNISFDINPVKILSL